MSASNARAVPVKDVNEEGIFGNRPIHVAAVRGDLIELAALLDGGADVNAVGERGRTALHFSVGQNMSKATQFLLSRGAQKAIGDEDGRTALDLARSLGHDELVQERQ
jgi:ankyrin repeat protein